MPKEIKPKRSTLTAADLRKIREVFQAELKPIRDEVRKLRNQLEPVPYDYSKARLAWLEQLNRMVNG